jgi:hypothetical protein
MLRELNDMTLFANAWNVKLALFKAIISKRNSTISSMFRTNKVLNIADLRFIFLSAQKNGHKARFFVLDINV